jgi:hypothetical protein
MQSAIKQHFSAIEQLLAKAEAAFDDEVLPYFRKNLKGESSAR